MANAELISGVDSFVLFGTETTFGTKASSVNTHLGLVMDFSSTITRNATEHRGFVGSSGGGQLPEELTSGRFESNLSVEFKPLEWSWLEQVMGAVSGTGTNADPFVYTFTANPDSLTFAHNLNHVTTDRNEIYLGCKFGTVTIRATVGEVVTVSADLMAADMNKSSTLETNQSLPTGQVFNFSGATLELPDASAISHIIDSIEITINRNPERKYGLGAFTAKNTRHKGTEIRVNFTVNTLDEEFIEDVLGGTSAVSSLTENATLTVDFTGAANKIIRFKFTNVSFPDWTEAATLNEFITEGMTGWARGLTVNEEISA